jgi:hypothetical protein
MVYSLPFLHPLDRGSLLLPNIIRVVPDCRCADTGPDLLEERATLGALSGLGFL